VVTRGVTSDNAANLAPSFLKTITEKYAGTRLGRQELSAEILDDVPDALWTRARSIATAASRARFRR
jgi:phage terminase large subunit-like protein